MDLKPVGFVREGLSRAVIRPRLRAVVRNADHRSRHTGLAIQISKHTGIKVDTLEQGEFVLCVNSKGTILTLYGPNATYVQQRREVRIGDERALQYMPELFLQKKRLDYDDALRKFLLETFPKWRK